VAGSLTHATRLIRILPKRCGWRDDVICQAHAVVPVAANRGAGDSGDGNHRCNTSSLGSEARNTFPVEREQGILIQETRRSRQSSRLCGRYVSWGSLPSGLMSSDGSPAARELNRDVKATRLRCQDYPDILASWSSVARTVATSAELLSEPRWSSRWLRCNNRGLRLSGSGIPRNGRNARRQQTERLSANKIGDF